MYLNYKKFIYNLFVVKVWGSRFFWIFCEELDKIESLIKVLGSLNVVLDSGGEASEERLGLVVVGTE